MLGVRNLVEQGHEVGGRFAGAGLSAGDEVFAGQNLRNRLLLNGRGVEVVHGVHAGQQVVVEVEIVEGQRGQLMR